MNGINIITENGRKMAVMPLARYERLMALLEDKEDVRDAREAREILARVKTGKEPLVPVEVVRAIVGGEHPIRAWRRYRKLTAEKLAEKAGIARAYLSQIEGRKRKGTIEVLRQIAKALRTDIDSLV